MTRFLKGTINSLKEDCPGVSLTIQLDDEHFSDEYSKYIEKPDDLRSIPIEYYEVLWQSFAGNLLDTRSMPIRSAIIDPASISNTYGANRYIVEIMEDYLSKKAKVDLALSYRKMRDQFLGQEKVSEINVELKKRGEAVSDKTLSLALDMTTRAGWETGVIPHLDNIPLPLVGRGEQNSIKIKLAMEGAEAKDACKIFLVEEPENHLSHTNLNRLIEHLATRTSGKQLIVTTHSSFVLNKLGVDSIKMFNGSTAVSLSDLTDSTKAYFRRLPGHDTLRMILAKRTILVEGPSDELVVTKAFFQKHGKTPLQAGVEVISVNSLAFKRFLEIAKSLNLQTSVVTDNDGDAAAVKEGYAEYANDNIRICYSTDNLLYTLETHLCRLNSRDKLNGILGKHFEDDEKLLEYMLKNKTECALKILESKETISIPEYIQDAIK